MLAEEQLRSVILDFIHEETGWGNPLRPRCEFEDLEIREVTPHPDGSLEIEVWYHFDEDGFSQYDKTHILEGRFTISISGTIDDMELEETHTGVAAVRNPYGSD